MTTISTERGVATPINVFTVAPENQQRVVDALAEAAAMKTVHGYVSCGPGCAGSPATQPTAPRRS